MTHEEIIDAALKVNGNVMWWPMYKDTIYQFAEMIAAHERAACIKACEEVNAAHEGDYVLASWCIDAIRERGKA